MKKNAQRTGGGGRFHCVATLVASLAFAADSAAQFTPLSSGCADPAPPQTPRIGQWYPSPPQPEDWADRHPTAVIHLWNGNWQMNDRGLENRWWDGNVATPGNCTGADEDNHSGFTVETGAWAPGANGRPDQFDWLIAQLDYRYNRGYRRFNLRLPAGVVVCQDMPASQWWPMDQWRREWFAEEGDPQLPNSWGVAGWLKARDLTLDPVELSVYMGWQIGDPCSICYEPNTGTWPCQFIPTLTCNPHSTAVDVYRRPCLPGQTTGAPNTLDATHLAVIWQNVDPWRRIGVARFWIDASSGAAEDASKEWRHFAYNENLRNITELVDPVFGGEAFPVHPQGWFYSGRHTPRDEEFDFTPWVTDLVLAEKHYMNGRGCAGEPNPANAHHWFLGATPVREGAIFFSEWPKCDNGSPHPDWDGIMNDPPYDAYSFERFEHLYKWYICHGYSFWQGDLLVGGLPVLSGAAERIFGFGQIVPAGDFDGDGQRTPADWAAYDQQWTEWHDAPCTSEWRLTYYHGDMDSDGDVDPTDRSWAQQVILNGAWTGPWYLGEGGSPALSGSHKMNWNPNEQWLPCGCEGGTTSSAFGPP